MREDRAIASHHAPPGARSYESVQGGEGVLAGALQSEREEETRERAERGSAVRGSDQASVAAEEDPLRRTGNIPTGGNTPTYRQNSRAHRSKPPTRGGHKSGLASSHGFTP